MGGNDTDVADTTAHVSEFNLDAIRRQLKEAQEVHERIKADCGKWVVIKQLSERNELLNENKRPSMKEPGRNNDQLYFRDLCHEDETLIDFPTQKTNASSLLNITEGIQDAHELSNMSNEDKDRLIHHLLKQVTQYQEKVNALAKHGETLATKLFITLQEEREAFQVEKQALQKENEDYERKLQEALHHHPDVKRLEKEVLDAREELRRESDKLRFAVRKLQQSRRKEHQDRIKAPWDP